MIIQRTEDGSGFFEWRGRRHPVPVGHAFVALVPEKSRYGFGGGDSWSFSWINLYGGVSEDLAGALRERFGPVLPLPAKSAAAEQFLLLCQQRSADPYHQSVECYRFLAEWLRSLESPGAEDPCDAAMKRMEQQFRESLPIKALAADLGLSREHFTRLFTARYGVGPAEALRTIRRRHAEVLLNATPLSLKEIAFRSGFPSVQALHRAG